MRRCLPVVLVGVAAYAAALSASEADVHVISWGQRLIRVYCPATEPAHAARMAVGHLVCPLILHQDIFKRWQQEIDEHLLGNAGQFVRGTAVRPDGYVVEVDYRELTRALVRVLFGDIGPRVAVCATETLLRRPRIPDPAVETQIQGDLLACGLQVVDLKAVDEVLAREHMLQAAKGDANSRRWLQAELRADIVVYAEGVAVEAGPASVEVRTEIKCIQVDTGRVLAATSSTSALRRMTLEVAAKEALRAATAEAMPKVIAAVLNAYGKPVHTVRLWNVGSLRDVIAVRRALLNAFPKASVRVASIELRAGRTALLQVATKRTAATIAIALEEMQTPRLEVQDIGCRSIVARVR